MRYSIESKDRIYVKGYGFLSFAKRVHMSTHLSNKYGQKLLDTDKKSTTDAIKTASKIAIQKTAEVTGDFSGNKIADKIASHTEKSNNKLPKDKTEVSVEKATTKKRYISPEEIQQIIDELRLV